MIGISAINYSDKVIGSVLISLPWDFLESKNRDLLQSKKPKFFIQGTQDKIAHYEKFKDNFEYCMNPKKSKIINGADHFYWGYEEEVSNEVVNFYKSLV